MAKWDTLKKQKDFYSFFFLPAEEKHSTVVTSHNRTLEIRALLYPFSNPHLLKMCQSAWRWFYIYDVCSARSETPHHLAVGSSEVHSFHSPFLLPIYSIHFNMILQIREVPVCLWDAFPQLEKYQGKLSRKGIIRKGKLQIMEFKKINWQDFSFVQSLYITQSEWHCSVT